MCYITFTSPLSSSPERAADNWCGQKGTGSQEGNQGLEKERKRRVTEEVVQRKVKWRWFEEVNKLSLTGKWEGTEPSLQFAYVPLHKYMHATSIPRFLTDNSLKQIARSRRFSENVGNYTSHTSLIKLTKLYHNKNLYLYISKQLCINRFMFQLNISLIKTSFSIILWDGFDCSHGLIKTCRIDGGNLA